VRAMSRHTARPVIFALSSPTPELSAAQAYHWSDGQAIFANFEGVQEQVATPDGRILSPSKVQSVYVFPGVALATCVTRCGFGHTSCNIMLGLACSLALVICTAPQSDRLHLQLLW
jgi:malate dehydrogenase (oxaloacetate-decarboxylating)(NADP+)